MYNLTPSQKELISSIVRLIRERKLSENFTVFRDGEGGVFVQKPREKTGFRFSNIGTQEFDALARTELLIVDVLEPRFGLLNCTLRGKAYEAVNSNFGSPDTSFVKHLTPSAKKTMELAISIAKQADAEDARLHPMLGAVLVRDDQILASSFRGELGPDDHAEFTLLQKKLAGENLSGSILFTTLEPCTARKAHKTCAEWIVERKVGCVFVGMLDPNPRIYSLVLPSFAKVESSSNSFLPIFETRFGQITARSLTRSVRIPSSPARLPSISRKMTVSIRSATGTCFLRRDGQTQATAPSTFTKTAPTFAELE